MQCNEIMKRRVELIAASDSVLAAARRMWEADVGFLPVCSADGSVVGTLTDRDLAMRVVANGLPLATIVGDVMNGDPITVRAHDSVNDAVRLMTQHHKSRIICTLDGRVVGLLSLSDVAAPKDRDDGDARSAGPRGADRPDARAADDRRAPAIRELAWESLRQLRRGVAGLVAFPAAAALAFGALCMTLSLCAEAPATGDAGAGAEIPAHRNRAHGDQMAQARGDAGKAIVAR
jgi:CBS domain-containing protein